MGGWLVALVRERHGKLGKLFDKLSHSLVNLGSLLRVFLRQHRLKWVSLYFFPPPPPTTEGAVADRSDEAGPPKGSVGSAIYQRS